MFHDAHQHFEIYKLFSVGKVVFCILALFLKK